MISLLVVLLAVYVGYFHLYPSYVRNLEDKAAYSGKTIFDFSVDKPDENGTLSLQEFKGKKAYLVVNVASQCGLTDKNYAGLQELYEKYRY
jgi:glutathione peroxidase